MEGFVQLGDKKLDDTMQHPNSNFLVKYSKSYKYFIAAKTYVYSGKEI